MKFRNHIYLPYCKAINPAVKKLRKNMTPEENMLWYQYLRCYPTRFIRQKAVANFILDFYCAKCRLGVEIDGIQHALHPEHDAERSRILGEYGVTVIRFTNSQVDGCFYEECAQIDMKTKEILQGQK